MIDEKKLIEAIDQKLYGMQIIPKRAVIDIIRTQPKVDLECGDCSRRKWYQIGFKDAVEKLKSTTETLEAENRKMKRDFDVLAEESMEIEQKYWELVSKNVAPKENTWKRIETGEFPKENQFVFIMLHSGDIVQAQLDGEKWRFGGMFSVGKTAIVAWMPIPEIPKLKV